MGELHILVSHKDGEKTKENRLKENDELRKEFNEAITEVKDKLSAVQEEISEMKDTLKRVCRSLDAVVGVKTT